jgi:hypothetical protein
MPTHLHPIIRNSGVLDGTKETTLLPLHAPEMTELIPHLGRIGARSRTKLGPSKNILAADAGVCRLYFFRLLAGQCT